MISKQFIVHLSFMVLGYIVSTLAAAFIISLVLVLTMPDSYNTSEPVIMNQISSTLREFFALFFLISIFISAFALPVWLVTVVVVERFNITTVKTYLVTGLFAAVPFLIGKAIWFEANPPIFWFTLMFAGLVSGFIYWAIAGRKAGIWKQATERAVRL